MNQVDTLIQNALVFDGSGAEPVVQTWQFIKEKL